MRGDDIVRPLRTFDGPVVYTTLVVALVLVPVLTLSGLQGAFFAALASAFILATLISLVVDCLIKPFAFTELTAHLNAIVRRPQLNQVETVLRAGGLGMDLLRRGGRRLDLQAREFALLEELLRNAGRVVTAAPRPWKIITPECG